MGHGGDLTDAQWERLEPLLPVSNRRCGRWRDHRQVVNGVLYRIRTDVQWRDLPERHGPWKTVHERHRRWSAAAPGSCSSSGSRPRLTRPATSTGMRPWTRAPFEPTSTRPAPGWRRHRVPKGPLARRSGTLGSGRNRSTSSQAALTLKSREGKRPKPVVLPHRMWSSTHAWPW
uniref:transposase n=1 Tax=Streptomyces filipinensis TaxID=66887 RepID=UPI001782950D